MDMKKTHQRMNILLNFQNCFSWTFRGGQDVNNFQVIKDLVLINKLSAAQSPSHPGFRLLGSGMNRKRSTIQDIYCLPDFPIPLLNTVMSLNIEDTGGQFHQVGSSFNDTNDDEDSNEEEI